MYAMIAKREKYLKMLVDRMWNGQVKVVTGIRRCGKSFLLKTLFYEYLIKVKGVAKSNVLMIELDDEKWLRERNPLALSSFVRAWAKKNKGKKYLFVDEIQMSDEVPNPHNPEGEKIRFYDALNGFLHLKDLDVYVTGSNAKMLSSDIRTEFRGRGDEIRLHPLSFAEYLDALKADKHEALDDYLRYGGMPFVWQRPDDAAREAYLKSLFEEVYLRDIVERKKIERIDVLNMVTDFLCSGIGSLTNPNNIANHLNTANGMSVSTNTVASYVDSLRDAFLFSEARRYDVKGRTYFDYPNKYYCEDVGLRNARTEFRHQEMTHLMENVIYNELIVRGFSVDVGVVYARERNAHGNLAKTPREIDFVVNKSGERVYVQSAYALPDDEKRDQELKPFSLTGDSFRKIIVRGDVGRRWFDDTGVLNIGLIDFLLDDKVI